MFALERADTQSAGLIRPALVRAGANILAVPPANLKLPGDCRLGWIG
jgi:hypothetical protein